MDEAKFIKEFMALTSCSEATARSVYIHTEALRATEKPLPAGEEENAGAAAPASPLAEPRPAAE